MKTYEIAGLALGGVLVSLYLIIRIRLGRKSMLTNYQDKVTFFWGFVCAYIGIWLLSVFGFVVLNRFGILPFSFTILVGAVTGLFLGGMNFIFWGTNENYKITTPLGTSFGGISMGCFGFFLSLLIGIILAWFLTGNRY